MKKITPPVILFILGIAFFLRIPLLNGSFWMDEAAQALESVRPFSQQFQLDPDFQPPLMHLSVKIFSLFGRGEWWLRMVPLISGIVTIWATYHTVLLLTKRSIAILTSILLATSSFHIFYSQELRPYALMSMWTALSWLVIIHIIRHDGIKKQLLALFTVFSIAGWYSTYLYPFAMMGQLLFLLSRRKPHFVKQILISSLATGCAFLPWLPFLQQQLMASAALRLRTPNWEEVVSTPQLKALQLVFGKFIFGVIDLDANIFFISMSIIILALMFGLGYALRRHFGIKTGFLICCWFILPVFSIWIFSFLLPVLQPKRVLFTLPALEFFLSSLIVFGVQQKKTRLFAGFLGGLIITAHLYGTLAYFTTSKYQRENWRSIITQIDKNYSPTDTVVVFGFDAPFAPWDWYTHQTFPLIVTGTDTKTEVAQFDGRMTKALDYKQVIVFDYLRDLTDPNRSIEKWLTQYNYQQAELLEDPNIGFVRVFMKGGSFADNSQRHN